MYIELKIKAKHLALEPAIIRNEEKKLKKQIKWAKENNPDICYLLKNQLERLVYHRKWDVRNEARATNLTRAFLNGKPYFSIESKRREEYLFQHYIIPRIVTMVTKYGIGDQKKITAEIIREWSKI